jgi:hypothetical protein
VKKTPVVATKIILAKHFDYVIWSDFFGYIFLMFLLMVITWFILCFLLYLGFSYYWRDFWPRFPKLVWFFRASKNDLLTFGNFLFPKLVWFFRASKNDFVIFETFVYRVAIKPYIQYWTFFTPFEAYFISTYVLVLLIFEYYL